MSEHWKSTPKYWCKHCSAYIRDTLFERKQHESTAKHQNSLKRFLRDIQNDHERGEREQEKAKAEVERLNRITGGGTAQIPSTATATALTFHKEKTGPRTADDQKRQWQQLADMGIAVPDHVQSEIAMVGNWKAVPQQNVQDSPEESLSVGVRKRKLEDEDEENEEAFKYLSAKKVWGKSVKILPEDDRDNLDALLSTSIPLKKEKQEPGNVVGKTKSVETTPTAYQDEAPNQDTPDMSENHKPVPIEGVKSTPWSLADSASVELVKHEAIDDTNKESVINNIPEVNPAPVFKKRSKANENCAK